eukprot:4991462-Alexandrium_andersonii.AAC.1
MSDIAEGGTWWLSASLVAGPAPAHADSARPDCSPCPPWAGAARADVNPPPEDRAPSGRDAAAAAAASTRFCAWRARCSLTRSSTHATP